MYLPREVILSVYIEAIKVAVLVYVSMVYGDEFIACHIFITLDFIFAVSTLYYAKCVYYYFRTYKILKLMMDELEKLYNYIF